MVTERTRHAALARAAQVLCWALVVGCAPDLDDRLSIIDRVTIIAVSSEPPEATPDTSVTYTALVVDGAGERGETADWAFCNERKPLAILGPVSPLCMNREGPNLTPLGTGPSVSGGLPRGGCRVFGPETPAASGAEPPRPFDPDDTGGYYQPVRLLDWDGERELSAVGRTRLDCGVQGATGEVSREHRQRYRTNTNPAIDRIVLTDSEVSVELPEEELDVTRSVEPGRRLVLRVEWEACADELAGLTEPCTGSEPFLHFNLVSRQLVERTEALSVAWYATAGEFAQDRTGRGEGDRRSFDENVWTAPSEPSLVNFWVVIRDNRGGVGWRRGALLVED